MFSEMLERVRESEKLFASQGVSEQPKPNLGLRYSECRTIRKQLLL